MVLVALGMCELCVLQGNYGSSMLIQAATDKAVG